MSAETQRPGLRERKKARTRASIQEHALRLFRERGYAGTTVEQIIDAAEVSESTLFRYFPAKEDVVLQDDLDAILVATYKAQPAGTAPSQALRVALRAVLGDLSPGQRAVQRDRIALILSVPDLRARMLDQFFQATRMLAEAVAERAGRDPSDFAVRTVAGALVGALMAVLLTMAEDPGAELAPLADRAIAQLESGIRL
ncbi:MAG: TetR family transcriptional regulator [Candidatus Dormibacteraceae bacterium]